MSIIADILLTVILYMGVPVIILIFRGKMDKKKAKKIALWNSVIVGLLFCVITTEAGGTWSAGPAVLYYFINLAILKNKAKEEGSS